MPRPIAYVVLVLPVLGSLVVVASRASKPLFKLLTGEDRILEWGQFALYVVAALAAAAVVAALARQNRKLPALAWLAFAVFLFFVAGEEISWGQRIFHYRTGLEAGNEQDETSIHNLGTSVNALFAAFLAIAGLYGAVAPWVRRTTRSHSPALIEQLFVPPLFLTVCFAIVFAYRFLRWTVFQEDTFTVAESGEWPEFCFALGVSVFAGLNARRAQLRLPAGPAQRPRTPEQPR